jgi:transmembrane 9 superfamily protein 2/4
LLFSSLLIQNKKRYYGYKRDVIEVPCKVNQIPRQVPPQVWYQGPLVSVLMGGVLPFGAIFIELFFILSSLWLHQFYYLFPFLFLVFIILIVTCAEITIVMTYDMPFFFFFFLIFSF